jgi:hypothetical protein
MSSYSSHSQQQQQQQELVHSTMQQLHRSSLGAAASMPFLAQRGFSDSSSASSSSSKVRAVVTVGGCFRRAGAAGAWEYVGGAQKVVVLPRAAAFDELLGLLSSRAEATGLGCGQVKVSCM